MATPSHSNVSVGPNPPAPVPVPDATDKTEADARALLEQAGFKVLTIPCPGRHRGHRRRAQPTRGRPGSAWFACDPLRRRLEALVAAQSGPSVETMRVGLFVTCLGDTLFPEASKAVVRVLERLGHEVEFPDEQTCCGQLHANSGYRDGAGARCAVRADLRALRCGVSPSSSCVGLVRDSVRRSLPASSSFRSSSSRTRASRTSVLTSHTGSPTTRPAIRCA